MLSFLAASVSVPASVLALYAQQLATPPPPPPPPPPAATSEAPPGLEAQQAVQRPGASLLNPALSFVLDGTFGYYGRDPATFQSLGLPPAGDDPTDAGQGFGVQEIEMAAQAALDPYFEGAIFLTIPNLEGIEVEEGYLVTTALPFNLQLKAGTFRSQVGRNNGQHLHQQSFTRRPLMTSLLFGADGFRGPGAQASVLLPLPWFATLYAEAFSIGAPEEAVALATFGGGARSTPANLAYTGVLEQSWDLTDDTAVVLGLNFATGRSLDCAGMAPCDPAAATGPRSLLYGGDLYLKWKPASVAQTYASFAWTTEMFLRTLGDGGPTEGAGYSEGVLQFARRWFVGARFDVTGLPSGPSVPRRYGYAGSLTFTPSEFTRVRLYAQELAGAGLTTTVGFLQVEYSMGAHGAHPF